LTDLPAPAPIREFTGVDRRMFEEEIRPLGAPAVLRGLGAGWPVVQAAQHSPEAAIDYLMAFDRDRRDVSVLVGAPEIEGRFFYTPDYRDMNFTRGEVPLAGFFERLLHDRDAERPFSLAVQSEVIAKLLPGFVEANRTDLLDPSIQPRIWIGNRIRVAPHYDLMENIGVVAIGRRRFTLFPPEQIANLYIGPIENTPAGTPVSVVDVAAPDLTRFPRYAEAAKTAQSAVLEQGDGIYIPYHWWHGVDSLETVNAFVNYWWNPAQPGLGNPYDALMFAFYALRGLPEDQRDAWRRVFDHLVFMTDGDPVAHLPEGAKGVLGPITPEKLRMMRATIEQMFARK
jgi:hypothetical protein